MGLFGFGKKDKSASGNGASGADAKPVDEGFKPNQRKAKSWFDQAHKVADTQNFDYALDCFIHGLGFDPADMKEHEALYDVAKRRTLTGGKGPTFSEKNFGGGKTPVEKLVNSEKLWAKDPKNADYALTTMTRAVEAHGELEHVDLSPVVNWVGERLLEMTMGKAAGTKAMFEKMMANFEQVENYKLAVEACRRALMIAPGDGELLDRLKNLDAQKAIVEARMTGKEGGFREGIKDKDKQAAIQDEIAIGSTDEVKLRNIKRNRDALAAKPDDLDLRLKLVAALREMADDEHDEEAIKILKESWEKSDQYRFKEQMGEIIIKQFQRQMRMLKETLAQNPADESLKKDIEKLHHDQVMFELAEFEERVKNYPTIMKWRFEWAKRLVAVKRHEEAVAIFQDASADLKIRVPCMAGMAECYLALEWLDPAIDTLKSAIAAHPLPGDALGLWLKYLLITALERQARKLGSLDHAREAQSVASTILQLDIRYRDIRDRVSKLKQLVDELVKKATP